MIWIKCTYRVIYLRQFTDCDNCNFAVFIQAFTTVQEPWPDFFTSVTEDSFALIHAEVSLQISPFSLKPSILGAVICASFTVPAAGKSIQPTPPARKIIMVTQTALSWHTSAILFSSAGSNSVIVSTMLQQSSVCRFTTLRKGLPSFSRWDLPS